MTSLLERILSGGQTGVDQSALRAARAVGLVTGGSAPRGWATLDGPAPWLADYGLVESAWDYAGRTSANVRDSDATVRIARDFGSPGEICTLRAVEKWGKPSLDVRWDDRGFVIVQGVLWLGQGLLVGDDVGLKQVVWCVREFLKDREVRVLNVAGNSERTAPGIGAATEALLVEVFRGLA